MDYTTFIGWKNISKSPRLVPSKVAIGFPIERPIKQRAKDFH